jgi:hypothetical protein
MAGSLIKIAETTVSSAVSSVSLVGIDSTYDVYMVRINNYVPSSDAVNPITRVTVSGTAQTTSNYDRAFKVLRADATFQNVSGTNRTAFDVLTGAGTGTGEQNNAVLYLFNFANASEYSFITVENTSINASASTRGSQGGAVYTVAEAHDGLFFGFDSGNIASGQFVLYGLKKS